MRNLCLIAKRRFIRVAWGCLLFTIFPAIALAEDSLTQRYEKSTQILEEIRRDITLGSQQEARLAVEIAALDNDKTALTKKLVTSSEKSRALEQKIQRTSARILDLENSRTELYESLMSRKSLLAEVLGALQRMGKNPPPALLVSPQDALISVRSAILLGSVVPEIRSETDILSTQLQKLVSLSKDIAEQRATLTTSLQSEATQERRLSLLIEKKRNRTNRARKDLALESVKAAKLAARATNLSSLIQRLQTEIEAVNLATLAAKKADDALKIRQNEQIATARREVEKPDFSDSSRISPAVGFLTAKGHLIKPVNGVEVRKFGDRDELGDPSPGIAIATRINARVISPADGWVVYSGPFRSYGQLLILNVGSKHHIVMSGMENINAELGQFVLVGEPVGIMGSHRIANASTIELGLSRPVLAIEFRNGSKSIDPAPWWQANTEKRSNNDS